MVTDNRTDVTMEERTIALPVALWKILDDVTREADPATPISVADQIAVGMDEWLALRLGGKLVVEVPTRIASIFSRVAETASVGGRKVTARDVAQLAMTAGALSLATQAGIEREEPTQGRGVPRG